MSRKNINVEIVVVYGGVYFAPSKDGFRNRIEAEKVLKNITEKDILTSLKIIKLYDGYYIAPSPKGFIDEEEIESLLMRVKKGKDIR